MVFPRLCALAEVGWSPQDTRNWGGFRTRLQAQQPLFEQMGVQYWRDPQVWDSPH
jgi:hexosaminidase